MLLEVKKRAAQRNGVQKYIFKGDRLSPWRKSCSLEEGTHLRREGKKCNKLKKGNDASEEKPPPAFIEKRQRGGLQLGLEGTQALSARRGRGTLPMFAIKERRRTKRLRDRKEKLYGGGSKKKIIKSNTNAGKAESMFFVETAIKHII